MIWGQIDSLSPYRPHPKRSEGPMSYSKGLSRVQINWHVALEYGPESILGI